MSGAPELTTRPVPQQGVARREPDTETDGTGPSPTPYDDNAYDDNTWTADPYADALRTGRGPLFLRRADGWLLLLEVERWCAEADGADLEVLRRCEGSVLDVGCGPGRLVVELGARGRPVLGIDVSEAAVARTVGLGGQALRRSVFEPLPAEGRWGTVLLIDGNIGIGGDPVDLLRRCAELVRPDGLVLVEVDPDDSLDDTSPIVLRTPTGRRSTPLPWARIGTHALLRHARRTNLRPTEDWRTPHRAFLTLRRTA